MKRSVWIILYLIVLFFISALYSRCENDDKKRVSNPVQIVDENGAARNYNLYFPRKSNTKVPLLVYFHGVMSKGFKNKAVLKGYTGSPLSETGLIPFCRVNRIALLEILPSYTYKFMDLTARGWSPFSKEIGGIEKCIDTVVEEYNVDKKKVYLAGISAGAVLANHLANKRPEKYAAILSHSQGYISENNDILMPAVTDNKFGVVICYTKGDYDDLKNICEKSYEIYKKNGYNIIILRNLPPASHKWSNSTNGKFWRLLLRIGGDT